MVDLERLERSPVGAASTTLPILIAMTALILVGGQAHAAGPPNLRDLLFGRHGDESSRGADAPGRLSFSIAPAPPPRCCSLTAIRKSGR
jgi:hypothetical protein